MGFLDKAKEAAKQAQQKLDETQQKFNAKQAGRQQQGGAPVEYDEQGRPIKDQQRPAPTPFAQAGMPGSTGDAPPTPYVEAPPPAGPPPGHPAAKAAAIAPVGPRPGVTMPQQEGPDSSAPVESSYGDSDNVAPDSGAGAPDSGAGAPPPAPHAGGPPEGVAEEEEVIHGEPSAPPGPPPSEPMGPPPTPGQQDPNAPPRMTSGDPLGS